MINGGCDQFSADDPLTTPSGPIASEPQGEEWPKKIPCECGCGRIIVHHRFERGRRRRMLPECRRQAKKAYLEAYKAGVANPAQVALQKLRDRNAEGEMDDISEEEIEARFADARSAIAAERRARCSASL